MFYIRFKKILLKKWANHSFPLFWWAMWVNRSGRSPKMSDVSESLMSLTKNERCEQIAQVDHQKWATSSDSLKGNERWWGNCSGRSPKKSEGVNRSFFEWIAHLLIFGQQKSDSLGKPMSEFPALKMYVQ